MRRLFFNLILGLVVSILGAIIMAAIGLIANLPRIIQGAIWVFRHLLRVSYELYAAILLNLWQPVADLTGLDASSPTARTMACLLFSIGIGIGILLVLNWQIGFWWLAIFAAHGLTVGYFWEQLVHPGEFQLGTPEE